MVLFILVPTLQDEIVDLLPGILLVPFADAVYVGRT